MVFFCIPFHSLGFWFPAAEGNEKIFLDNVFFFIPHHVGVCVFFFSLPSFHSDRCRRWILYHTFQDERITALPGVVALIRNHPSQITVGKLFRLLFLYGQEVLLNHRSPAPVGSLFEWLHHQLV